jgi:glyoxylase-like metal-dependent hydrolase (beta-lactamase superfamily II)
MIREVAQGVYQIALAWSNAYLLKEGKDAALVDTGLQKDRHSLLAALRQVGVEKARVRAVLLTHGHCDHAGNAAFFARRHQNAYEEPGAARIYAHRNEARFLSLPKRSYVPTGWRRLLRPQTALAFAAGEILYPVERCGVDGMLVEGETIETPGGPLRVVACPGHTPGHVAYFRERDGLLFSGDAVLNIIPVRRVLGLSLPMRSLTDDWRQAKRSARKLAELRPAALLAGHGWPLTEPDTAARLLEWARALR